MKSLVRKQKSLLVDTCLQNILCRSMNDKYGITTPSVDKDWLRNKYCIPLFKLLIDSFDSPNIKQVYLDERLRYAPHKLNPEVRAHYFQDILNIEIDVLVSMIPDREKNKVIGEWLDFHKELIELDSKINISILAIGDCLLNEVRVFINEQASVKKQRYDFRCLYFSAGSENGLDVTAAESLFLVEKINYLAISFFTFDAMPGFSRFFHNNGSNYVQLCDEYLNICSDYLDTFTKIFSGYILVHNISGLPLSRPRKYIPFIPRHSRRQKLIIEYLNAGINKLISAQSKCVLIDEYATAEQSTKREITTEIAKQRKYKGLFHTTILGSQIAKQYRNSIELIEKYSKLKVILLDFDNTLWEGVMAEGVVSQFIERQKVLLEIKNRGVLLVAVSKNDPKNIRWQELLLTQEDFALLQISWQPKVESILIAAHELNLGMDSFIFIDDNHHERSMVENELPQISCLDATKPNTWSELEALLSMPFFKKTDESKKRTEMYRQEKKRKAAVKDQSDLSAMLSKLGLIFKKTINNKKYVSRLQELAERTNQFNTTTIRYTQKEILEAINNPVWVVMEFNLKDQFGDLGIVGLMIINIENKVARIDSLIMSCRAMGFGLENQMLFEVMNLVDELLLDGIQGKYIPSDRNAPCSQIYDGMGFKKDEAGQWYLSRTNFPSHRHISWLQAFD